MGLQNSIHDFDRTETGIDVVVKTKQGNLELVPFHTTHQDDIMEAYKKQNGKLSLRSAITRSKEPKDSTISTVVVVLRTEPCRRTDAQIKMLRAFLKSMDLFNAMQLDTELQEAQCCRYLKAEQHAAGDAVKAENSMVRCKLSVRN